MSQTLIPPTVGRVVWFYPSRLTGEAGFAPASGTDPLAAVISRVWSEALVNLAVFDANGKTHSRTSVKLIHEEIEGDWPAEDFCTWMPFQKGQAKAQEAVKKPLDRLSFGAALEHLKAGARVARAGWNGKGMFVYLNKGSMDGDKVPPSSIDGIRWSFGLFENGDTGTVTRLPNINMRAASGATVTGWLASQTDMLAEDWLVVPA